MSSKNRNKRVGTCLIIGTICIVVAALWVVLATPETALAKKPVKPDPVVLWDAGFVPDDGFGSEIVGSASEVAQSTYRTGFGTGNVVVTLSDGTVLDQKALLMRFTNDTTSWPERYLVFRIGLQGGHPKKDRYSTPHPNVGRGDPAMAIPFPETTDPAGGTPWLEVMEGSVDENLDMLPGAHVILHLHVSGVPLINMTGPNAGYEIGEISIGDIEFTFPE
jgi:hypothetical protein